MDVDKPQPPAATYLLAFTPFAHWKPSGGGFERFVVFESCGHKELFFRVFSNTTADIPTKGKLIAKAIQRLHGTLTTFTPLQNCLFCTWAESVLSDKTPVRTLRVSERQLGATTVLAHLMYALLETLDNAVIEMRGAFLRITQELFTKLPLDKSDILHRNNDSIRLVSTGSRLVKLRQEFSSVLQAVAIIQDSSSSQPATFSDDPSSFCPPTASSSAPEIGADVTSQLTSLSAEIEHLYKRLQDAFPHAALRNYACLLQIDLIDNECTAFLAIHHLSCVADYIFDMWKCLNDPAYPFSTEPLQELRFGPCYRQGVPDMTLNVTAAIQGLTVALVQLKLLMLVVKE